MLHLIFSLLLVSTIFSLRALHLGQSYSFFLPADVHLAPALEKYLRRSGQPVPEKLTQYVAKYQRTLLTQLKAHATAKITHNSMALINGIRLLGCCFRVIIHVCLWSVYVMRVIAENSITNYDQRPKLNIIFDRT